MAEFMLRVIHEVPLNRQPGAIAVAYLFAIGANRNEPPYGVDHNFFKRNKAPIQHAQQLNGEGGANSLIAGFN